MAQFIASGFEDCGQILITHSHQATPQDQRSITYTKQNPESTVFVHVEGGPKLPNKILRIHRLDSIGGIVYGEGDRLAEYANFVSVQTTNPDGQSCSHIREFLFRDIDFPDFEFLLNVPEHTAFTGEGQCLNPIMDAEVLDSNGNLYYPDNTPENQYSIRVEEFLGGSRINKQRISFQGDVKPVAVECADNPCPENCLPVYNSSGAVLCTCNDGEPNEVDDIDYVPYSRSNYSMRLIDFNP